MPQPIHKNKQIAVHHYPRCILERPKLAALIGTIAAEWGYIDSCLTDIYERTISDKLWRDAVAVAVFETLSSVHLKLELIGKVLRIRAPKALVDHFDSDVAPLIRNGARERATILHGDWGISEEYPDDLILKEAGGRLMRYTENDFLGVLDRITPVRSAAHNMAIKADHAPKKKP